MGVIEVFPVSTVTEQGSKTLVGGASALAVLSDGSDASYVRAAGTLAQRWGATFMMDSFSIPAGAVVSRIQMRMRYSHNVKAPPHSEYIQPVSILVGRPHGGGHTFFGFTGGEIAFPGVTTAQSPVQQWTGPYRMSTWDGKAWLGTLLTRVGARLHASVRVERNETAWNVARIYSLSLLVHYNEEPTATLSGPTGTQVVSRPTLEWDYSDPDGDPQALYDARVYTDAQYSAPGFTPDDTDRIPPVYWVSEWSAANRHDIERAVGANGDYVAAMRATHAGVGGQVLWSPWSYLPFTLDVEAPEAPTLTAIYDAAAHAVLVEAQGLDNLLSWGHSSFEVVPDPALIAGANTTLTRTTAQAAHGVWSYQLTRTGSTGTAAAIVHAPDGADWGEPVEPGVAYTARASFRSAVTARSCRVSIMYVNAEGGVVGVTAGSNVTDGSGAWVDATAGPAVAPATATHALVVCEVLAAAASESHYLDEVGLFPVTTAWNRGGWDDYDLDLERSLDGGATWEEIPDTHATLGWDPLTRKLTYADYDLASGQAVAYRARAEADNQDGDHVTGDWSTTATAMMETFQDWWIRDLASPGELSMSIHVASKKEAEPKPQTVDYPIGSNAAVVTHDGVKRPVLDLEIFLLSREDHDLFRSIIATGRTLLLQDPLGGLWYVQSADVPEYEQIRAAAVPGETTPVRHAHTVQVRFICVDKPVRRVP